MTRATDAIRARLAAGYVVSMALTDEQMIAALDSWIEQDADDIAHLLRVAEAAEALLEQDDRTNGDVDIRALRAALEGEQTITGSDQ